MANFPSHLTLDVRETLRFFDEAPTESGGHATAVVGILGEELGAALLIRHLKKQYGKTKILSSLCSTGKKQGPRLDYWVISEIRGRRTLFQVEIKNWNAHAIGGKTLSLTVSRKEFRTHKKERWNHVWTGNRFKSKKAQKVLTRMRPPVPGAVEPLICFWDAMHPVGATEPLFRVPLKKYYFKRVWIFSMSSYLRGLRSRRIRLDMPNTVRRLKWMKQLVSKR